MVKMDVKANLDKAAFLRVAEKQGKVGTQETAEAIYRRSQEACPVRTGDLKRSGYVKQTEQGAEVGYTAPYAQYVNHMPQSELESGQAHFFTNAVVGGKNGE